MRITLKITKKLIALVALLPIAVNVSAIETELLQCADINEHISRLQCFDNWVAQQKAAEQSTKVIASSSTSIVTVPPAPAKEVVVPTSPAVTPVENVVPSIEPALVSAPLISSSTVAIEPATANVDVAPRAANSQVLTADKLEQGFGVEHLITEEEQAVDSFKFTILKAVRSIHGKWTLTFTNQQKWQTLSTDRAKFKSGQDVIIARGVLNSFTLNVVGSNKEIKVKRLK